MQIVNLWIHGPGGRGPKRRAGENTWHLEAQTSPGASRCLPRWFGSAPCVWLSLSRPGHRHCPPRSASRQAATLASGRLETPWCKPVTVSSFSYSCHQMVEGNTWTTSNNFVRFGGNRTTSLRGAASPTGNMDNDHRKLFDGARKVWRCGVRLSGWLR